MNLKIQIVDGSGFSFMYYECLLAFMHEYYRNAWCQRGWEEGVRIPWDGIIGGY